MIPEITADKIVNKTVAIINEIPIFETEVNDIFSSIVEQYKQALPVINQNKQKESELKDIILEQKIEEIILKQEARKRKIEVSKKEIQSNILEIKKRFANELEFNAELKKENLKISDLEKKVGDQIIIMKLLRQSIGPKIKIPSETDARLLYEKAIEKIENSKGSKGMSKNYIKEYDLLVENLSDAIKKMSEEQVRLKQIFINCPKDTSSEKIKEVFVKIGDIKRELQKQTFDSLVRKYSEDKISSSKNGDLGVISKSDLIPSISDIIFSMEVGSYTKNPIKTDLGYHFIKIEEKRAKRNISFDDIKDDIIDTLSQFNERQAYINYIEDLKVKANVRISKTW
jgi:parvulin-like peptidyl-prolyl isomerase